MIRSPNTVLANCLRDPLDLIRPRLELGKATEVVFVVGTQINGVPHIGTYLVQCASFILAQRTRQRFGIDTSVMFSALDNAPHDIIKAASGHDYQRTYRHALPHSELQAIIDHYYTSLFCRLEEVTETKYVMQSYTQIQASSQFRQHFLRTLQVAEQIRWCVAPANGALRIRIPCPKCAYAEKYADRTELISLTQDEAIFRCMCLNHGTYEVVVTTDTEDAYLDLNTVYRNLVKESLCADDTERLYVMVKGGDWAFSCQPVDWGLGLLGYTAIDVPMRLFTPQIVTETGAKLSKSLIRDGDKTMNQVPEWILDMGCFMERSPNYLEQLIWLVNQFMGHPRHMYRAYSYQEIIRILDHMGQKEES